MTGKLGRIWGLFGVVAVCLGLGTLGVAAEENSANPNGATLAELRAEVARVDSEISSTEKREASLSEGLIKSLVGARLEILRMTRDMVRQRILAVESGATVTIDAPGTRPDGALSDSLEAEIATQSAELENARKDAAEYNGGLIGAMKEATVATKEQSLAMLQQRYLVAKYGLLSVGSPVTSGKNVARPEGDSQTSGTSVREAADPSSVVGVKLLSKRFAAQDYQEYLWFDIEISAKKLGKPARAIKGVLIFQDLFGDPQLRINWTIDAPLKPGESIVEKGSGFEYNQFRDAHQWVRNTDLSNMTASYTVKSILYQDGSRQDF